MIIIIIIHLAPYYRLPRLAHKAPVMQAKPRTEWRGDALRAPSALTRTQKQFRQIPSL